MLTKWKHNRPTKFSDYLSMPSRYDLSHAMLGMYNMAWSFQQVADAVGMRYSNTPDARVRSEMITSSLIAHRRKRMLGNMENWDTASVVARRLNIMPSPRQAWHSRYIYDGNTGQARLVRYWDTVAS